LEKPQILHQVGSDILPVGVTENRGAIRQIKLVGSVHWAGVLRAMFAECGIDAGYVTELEPVSGRLRARWRLWRWGSGPAPRAADLVHHVYVSRSLILPETLHHRGIVQVMHWIGSDVIGVAALPRWRRAWWVARVRRTVDLHLADSPELAEEVARLGLPQPRVVRLLPMTLRAQPSPPPATFRVLSYWSDLTFRFYRGDWVLRLAREFPSIAFRIVGRCTAMPDAPPNVEFAGWVEDMDRCYEEASVLIRLPKHDSISVMVLEVLARGRHAIYSRSFPHCSYADTYEAARDALAKLVEQNEPNTEAPDFVNREFNPTDAVAALRAAYEELEPRVKLRRKS
jgi:hypothetical protein